MVPESPPATPQRPLDPRILAERERVRAKLAAIRHKVLVMSGKGGVGKSSVATSLALHLARRGLAVGLLDMDLTGPDVPKMIGAEEGKLASSKAGIVPVLAADGVKVVSISYLLPDPDTAVIWRGPMKMGAIKQLLGDVAWGPLDWLVIDLPPGTSDEPLSIAQNLPDADGVVLVTTPQAVSVLDVTKSASFARQLGLEVLGVIENFSGLDCPHCGQHSDLFGSGGGRRLAAKVGVPFLGSIPIDPGAAGPDGSRALPAMARKDSPAHAPFAAIVDAIVSAAEARTPRPPPEGPKHLPMSR